MNHHNKKWNSTTRYVDVETGEIITKSLYEREYYKIKTTKKTTSNGNYNTTEHTTECRRTNQTELKF